METQDACDRKPDCEAGNTEITFEECDTVERDQFVLPDTGCREKILRLFSRHVDITSVQLSDWVE